MHCHLNGYQNALVDCLVTQRVCHVCTVNLMMTCAVFVIQCRLRDITYSAPVTVDIEYTRGSQVSFTYNVDCGNVVEACSPPNSNFQNLVQKLLITKYT